MKLHILPMLMSLIYFTKVNLQPHPRVDDALKVPTALDWTAASTVVQNITNTTSRYMLTFDLLFCPLSELCSVPQRQFTRQHPFLLSCCKQCSCNASNCLETNNCCPDVIPTNSYSKTSCISPQYLPYGTTSLNSRNQYTTIKRCNPAFHDAHIIRLCENNEKIPKRIDIATPIVSENMVYKNRYCAVCNYMNETSILPFSAQMRCPDANGVFAYSSDDLLAKLRKEKRCNIVFAMPINISRDVILNLKCDGRFISECNVTGRWEVYNSTIEQACSSYTHVYRSYRNVFCYLCNNNDDPFTACDKNDIQTNEGFMIGTFTAMLKLSDNNDYTTNIGKGRKCPSQSEYDPIKKSCIEVFCSSPFYYYNNTCVNIYQEENRYYEIFLQLNTTPQNQTQELRILSYLTSSPNICNTNKFRVHPSNTSTSDGIIVFHVIFSGTNNPKYLSGVLNIEQHLSSMGAKILTGIFYSDVNNFDNYTWPFNGGKMIHIGSLSTSGNCRRLGKTSRISRLLFCPYVVVNHDETELQMNNYELCLPKHNLCFDQLEFFRINSSHYSVCSNKIFNKTDSNVQNPNNVHDEIEGILSLVCTCISAACLLYTIFTYSFFKSLRTLPGKITLSLCVSLLIAHVLYTFGLYQIHIPVLCTVLGALIHFSWLCVIFWMNVCCINMFRVFVVMTPSAPKGKERNVTFLVYTTCVFLAAFLFLGINIGTSVAKGDGVGYGGNVCFITNHMMILLTFAVPFAIVIVSNLVLFLIVVIRISRLPNLKQSTTKDRNNFKIFIKLSTITGASWIFGFINAWVNVKVVAYTFIILTGFQGVYLMLAFSCNKRVRELYRTRSTTRSISYTVSSKTTSLSKSSTSDSKRNMKVTRATT